MNSTVAERFVYILQKHNLLGQNNSEILLSLENHFLLSPLAAQLLPDHYVSFGEPIYDASGYTRVIQQLSQITQGDWKPTQITEVYDEAASQARKYADIRVIEFDFTGQHFTWPVNQYAYGNTVCHDFQSALSDFAQKYLKGAFIRLPTADSTICFVYLSREAAQDFREIVLTLGSDEVVSLTKRFFELDLFGMMMLKEFCLQFDFKNINQVNAAGNLALNVAVQAQLDGKLAAEEVIHWLLDRGAKSGVPDARGQTAFNMAKADKKLSDLLMSFR